MTYTLGENHDQNYTCKCGQVERRKLTPAYKKDWRCGKCGFRLKIDMV
jgi:predicted SprT family Zn-dependent metalloprotease